jgi:hypothetical protein
MLWRLGFDHGFFVVAFGKQLQPLLRSACVNFLL